MSIKIDGPLYARLGEAAEAARRLASLGYDGVYTLEGSSDPFLPLLLAAEHAPGIDIATGIAVAFPRNPLHLAYQAWDLQQYSRGHFLLGLGSQVKAHIEKRFGVEFSPPAARMRDYILALKAIFACWRATGVSGPVLSAHPDDTHVQSRTQPLWRATCIAGCPGSSHDGGRRRSGRRLDCASLQQPAFPA